jgi:ferric hydroxamate transport system permease protein
VTVRTIWSLAAATLLLALALATYMALQRLPLQDWPAIPFDAARMTTDQIILAYAILPRSAVAILAGAILGLSGALLQRLLQNPIADPSTLGVSGGAQLAIVAGTLFFPEVLDGFRGLVALSGAFIAASIVFLLGWRRAFEPVSMVVSGLLVGVTASAVSAALTLSQGEYLMSLVTWNGGSLSQQDWSVSLSLLLQLIGGLFLTLLLIRPLVVLAIGDAGARSLGVSLFGIRFAIGALAVALSAGVSAAVGLVSFIGLAAPALVRGLGVRKPAHILFAAPVAGGLLLWLCDGLVQLLASTTSENFPTGAVTALIGGPLLLWLLPQVRSDDVHQPGVAEHQSRRSLRSLLLLCAFVPAIVFVALAVARSADGWVILNLRDFKDVLPLRWPRLLASAGAGGLLALAGAILQRLTGNPMASPEVIGVSGGAGIGFAAAITIFPAAGMLQLFAGAGLGAIVVMIIVLIFSSRQHLSPQRILLAGVAVSSFSSAILAALLAVGDQRSWQILSWLGGTASTATPASAMILGVLGIIILLMCLTLSRWLTIMPLGAAVPQTLGVPVRSARILMILAAGLATGAAALLVGPLSFVGLMAPHIAFRAGFNKSRDHMLATFLLGAMLMLIADIGARTVTFPYELPLGLFAAMAGTPYLIWLIVRRA